MNKKRVLLVVSCITLFVVLAVSIIGASFDLTKPLAVMEALVGNGEMPDYADTNKDGKVTILDVITLVKDGKLGDIYAQSIVLDDDNYTFEFDKYTKKYTVNLPAGRPPIPQVSATAPDGVNVEITQGYIADGETKGSAYVVVSKDKQETVYTIEFIRDKANGFVLQYDDRYEFVPEEKADYTFTSSNDTIVSVDENGLMTAKKVSDEAVTITATSEGKTEKLVIDRVEKAHINLFLMTGQSNGQGCFDNVSMDGEQVDESAQERYYGYMAEIEKIGQDGRVYSYDVHPRNENIAYLKDMGLLGANETLAKRFYDLNKLTKQGHFNSLGKEWYETTGEKVVFLQSAWSGSPIESWLDPTVYDFAGNYSGRNFWNTTKEGYNALIEILSENYEIIRTGNFWCQGETAMTAYYSKSAGNYITSGAAGFNSANLMTSQTYSEYFQYLHNDMIEEYGIEFSGIMMVRNRTVSNRAKISSLVTAFFELVNNEDNTIYLATRRFTEIAKKASGTTDEGDGFIDTGDLHYSQKGYNYHGIEAATNVLGAVFASPYTKATDVEIIDTDGIKRLENNYSFELKTGATYQIATLPIPWSSGENVKLTSSNPAIATVDQFGLIKGISAGDADITATAENGASRTIKVSVYGVTQVEYNYRWDFDDYSLASTKEKNDLTLSYHARNNGANYEIYTNPSGYSFFHNKNNLTDTARPSFDLEKPFTLDSESNWTLEWRGSLSSGNQCLLMGQTLDSTIPDGDTTQYAGYIYIWQKVWPDSSIYPLRFVPNSGKTIVFDMTQTYVDKVDVVNAWKLEYSKDTKQMKLSFFENNAWKVIDTENVSNTFSMTIGTLFGRLTAKGNNTFVGFMDYIDVHIETTAKAD